MDRDPLGIYDDPIVIRFEIPWLIGNDAAEGGTDQLRPVDPAADGMAQLYPVANPPSPAELVARWREGLAETAAEEATRRASMPDSRLIMGGVRSHPGLAVSGSSDGEVTLWRRGSDAAAPQALAALTLDLDGSPLFAGGQFVGRWFETGGEALFLPDWLRQLGVDLQRGATDLLGVPEAQAQEEEEPARRLGPGGRELSPPEELRLHRFNEAISELKEIEPNNPKAPSISSPQWVPDENTVEELEAELGRARERAKRRQNTSSEHRPYPGEPGGIPLRIEPAQQDKHVPGRQNYIPGRSIIWSDPQRLLQQYANKGEPIPTGAQRGDPGFKERFDTGGEIIGLYQDPETGQAIPTTRGMIVYSRHGAHIVPVRPSR